MSAYQRALMPVAMALFLIQIIASGTGVADAMAELLGNHVCIVVQGEVPGETPEKSNQAWPGRVQPTTLQCWPRRSDGQVTRCRASTAQVTRQHSEWNVICAGTSLHKFLVGFCLI